MATKFHFVKKLLAICENYLFLRLYNQGVLEGAEKLWCGIGLRDCIIAFNK